MFIGNNWITDKDKCTTGLTTKQENKGYETRRNKRKERRAQDRKHTKNRQQGNNTMRTSK